MKSQGRIVLASALVATLSVMVACAPAKRGTRFADRTSANGKLNNADRFFGKTADNEESKALQAKITYVDAMIEEAIDTQVAQEKLDKIAAERSENEVSGLPELEQAKERGEVVDETAGIGSDKNPLKNVRNEYLITVRLQIENNGALDYMRFNTQFGSEKNLIALLPAKKDCASKVAANISVRAACVDKLCKELAVQIKDESKANVFANLIMVNGKTDGDEIKVTRYEKHQAAVASDESAGAIAKPKMACADKESLTEASDEQKAKEEAAKEEAAKEEAAKEEAKKLEAEEKEKKNKESVDPEEGA